MLLLLPVIPVVLSSLLGLIISYFSSKFKGKNIIQIILTFAIVLGIFYFVTFEKNLMASLAAHASSINNLIQKIYYPAGVYITAITDFNLLSLLIFILINVLLFTIFVLVFSNVYFKTNSKSKEFSTNKNKNTAA